MKTKIVLAACLLAGLSGPAFADDQVCLRVGQILDWKALDNQTLIVEDNSHQKFKLDLMGTCTGLTFKQELGFKSVGGTELSCLTPGDYVLSHVMSLHDHCPIKTIEAYTPDMEKADKDAAAAKKDQ